MATPLRWSLVVPVKPRAVAKSRLDLPQGDRALLSLAMAADTVATVLACRNVAEVLVVSDDAEVVSTMSELGARTVADVPARGLNAALEYGVAMVHADGMHRPVACLAADLPALRAEMVERALQAASLHQVAAVADAAGTGTTLLTASPGANLPLAFGHGSLARHVAAGAVLIDIGGLEGLRLDVDTLADLRAAQVLGVGEATTAALATLRIA